METVVFWFMDNVPVKALHLIEWLALGWLFASHSYRKKQARTELADGLKGVENMVNASFTKLPQTEQIEHKVAAIQQNLMDIKSTVQIVQERLDTGFLTLGNQMQNLATTLISTLAKK
jgi:hypothetical protein